MEAKQARGTWIIITLPLIATIVYLAIFSPFSPPEPAPPVAKQGVLDLREWDFSKGGNVRLDGEWAFESSRGRAYRKLPHLWTGDEAGAPNGKGFGSYFLDILLPKDAPRLGIRFITTSTSFAAYADGVLFGAAGHPDPDPAKAIPAYKPQVAELPPAAGGKLSIRVDISNWEYRMGGMWRVPTLGDWARLVEQKRSDDFSAFILYSFLLSIATIALIFFLLRRKEKTFIVFSLFTAAMALRVICTGEYLIVERFTGIAFDTVIRLEYLSGYIAFPAIFLFFANLFPYLTSQRVKLLMIAPYGILIASLPFLPLHILTWTIFGLYAIMVPGILFLFFLIAKKVIPRENIDGSVIMAGAICLVLATINDIQFAAFIIYTGNILPTAIAFFIGIIGVLVAKRMLGSYEQAEVLSEKLAISNERLEEELIKSARTLKELEKSLDERELLIREIHHRVKNSLQIVASIISLQARRLPDLGMKQVFSAMKARIRAISLVHEKLYGLTATKGIGLNDYATDLVKLLDSVYAPPGKSLALELPAEEVEASVEFCVDFGLCLNELVSNAFKHGGADASCAIRLLIQDTSIRVEVRDGGPGFPDGFDPSEPAGLGLKIIDTLTRKSGGYFEAIEGEGAAISLPLR